MKANIMSTEPPAPSDRLEQIETELMVLHAVIARIAAFADPRARVEIVQMLTNAPQSFPAAQPRSSQQDAALRQAARDTLSRIAGPGPAGRTRSP